MCILPVKVVLEMTYTVSGGTLNPTHSLTTALCLCPIANQQHCELLIFYTPHDVSLLCEPDMCI